MRLFFSFFLSSESIEGRQKIVEEIRRRDVREDGRLKMAGSR